MKQLLYISIVTFYGFVLSNQFFQQFQERSQLVVHHNDKATELLVFLVLQKQYPDFFATQNLEKVFNKKLFELEQIKIPKRIAYHDLQGYLDYWYCAKVYGKCFSLVPEQYQIVFEFCKKSVRPQEALLTWIYLENLCFCGAMSRYQADFWQKNLERNIVQDNELRGYLLTHIILYDIVFGCSEPTQRSKEAFKQLKLYCRKQDPQTILLDLAGEIIICCKLLKKPLSKWDKTVLKRIKMQKAIDSFHQLAVFVLSVAQN